MECTIVVYCSLLVPPAMCPFDLIAIDKQKEKDCCKNEFLAVRSNMVGSCMRDLYHSGLK